MTNRVSSPLVTCSIDILANITSKLAGEDLLTLYCADKTSLRPRLVSYGGVRDIEIQKGHSTKGGMVVRFPIFPARFPRLMSLDITINNVINGYFAIGTLLYLPKSLTSLRMSFDSCMSAWLQPKEWMENNDETEFEEPFKPIYLDRLFPNLQRLELPIGSELFNPLPTRASLPTYKNLFDPPLATIMPEDRFKSLNSSNPLKLAMKWTLRMRRRWVEHLPRTITDLNIGISPMSIDEPEMFFQILPPHLTSLVTNSTVSSTHYATTQKSPPLKLSSMPASLHESLAQLTILCPSDTDFFDAPLPRHLTQFVPANSWGNIASGLAHALPQGLLTLKINQNVSIDDFKHLPSSITNLSIGTCDLEQLASSIPPKLTYLSINTRYSTLSATALSSLPDTLRTLLLHGEIPIKEEHIAAIPRYVQNLTIEGAPDSPLPDAALLRLPPNIRTLKLGRCSSHMRDEALRAIPTSVTELQLCSTFFSPEAISLLPPMIKSLDLGQVYSWSDQEIPQLPKTITKLKLSSLHVTGALLQEGITEITTEALMESVMPHLPPEVAAEKRLRFQTRFSDPVYFGTDYLRFIPSTVTKIDHSGKGGIILTRLEGSYPNLTHLSLPMAESNMSMLSYHFPNLTYLSMPKVSNMGIVTDQNSKTLFPSPLTYLDISSVTIADMPTLEFPDGLTDLSASSIPLSLYPKLNALAHLKTLRLANMGSGGLKSLLNHIPTSATHLSITSYHRTDNVFVSYLPKKLLTLDLPNMGTITDDGYHRLPKSLTKLNIGIFCYHDVDDYLDGPEMTSFESPKNLQDILWFKRVKQCIYSWKSGQTALVEGLNEQSSLNTELDQASTASQWAHLEDSKDLDELKKYFAPLEMLVSNHEMNLGPRLADVFSPTLTRLTLTQTHVGLDKSFFKKLPRTLLHLDILKHNKPFASSWARSLPPALISLKMDASEIVEPEFLGGLPRTLEDLELVKMPGRLTVSKAQLLPPHLTRLKLGLIIVGDDVIELLPRSLEILEILNAPFLTNKGIAFLPPQLTTLRIPTARVSAECTPLLPTGITSLSLGSGCGLPPGAILANLEAARQQKPQI